MAESLLIGKGQRPLHLLPHLANRHGLIAGATGTGKTVSLRVMAEQFSRIGVPVFMADVKGDLSGMAQAGEASDRIRQRIEKLEIADWKGESFPVTFWDVFGEQGHPVRATVSDMGPMLLARLLNLNETQSGVLTLVFKYADDHGLLLLDLKDLRATLQHVSDNSRQIRAAYGNVSAASVGAIQRALLELEQQGADQLFGEPALDIDDLMQTDRDGRGLINILVADKLLHTPKIYATLLLWLISELFERMPEVGDPEKPKVVFFFDEAHLLFDDAPKALLDKIEQLVRLIRSKGVGIYFVTRVRRMYPRACWVSSATACNMRCGHSRRRTRRPCERRRRPFARTAISMSRRQSPNSELARRWCPASTRTALLSRWSAHWSCLRTAG